MTASTLHPARRGPRRLPGALVGLSLLGGLTGACGGGSPPSPGHQARALASTGGPTLVRDLAPQSWDGLNALGGFELDGTLLFSGCDELHDCELWRSDGTAAGTVLLEDLFPGAPGGYPWGFEKANGVVFFTTHHDFIGPELWKTDGTAVGTVRLWYGGFLESHLDGASLTGAGGRLFFTVSTPAEGQELWTSDGTAAGTVRLKDVRPGAESSQPVNLTSLGATLYFFADDGTHGQELWRSDGTEAGTTRVKDLHPGSEGSQPGMMWDSERAMLRAGSLLYFTAWDGTSPAGLWRSDGTEAGTFQLSSLSLISSSADGWLPVGDDLYFTTNAGLWKTDGTKAGTVKLTDLPSWYFGSVRWATANGAVFFSTRDGVWKTDGTPAGTLQLASFPESSLYTRYVAAAPGGKVVFLGEDAAHGVEPWTTDGTPAGTGLLADLRPGPDSSGIYELQPLRDTLLLLDREEPDTARLWRSDGTPAGTSLVRRFGANEAIHLDGMQRVGERLFFSAVRESRSELWVSDGTVSGTGPVPAANPRSSWPGNLVSSGGKLFFTTVDPESPWTPNALGRSDGTEAGTVRLEPGPGTPAPTSLEPPLLDVNGTVFFVGRDEGERPWLWKAADAGLVRLVQLQSASTGASFHPLLARVGTTLFFTALDDTSRMELWKTDGTEAGTVLVKNLLQGPEELGLSELVAVGGTLYFSALDDTGTPWLWKSDGTAAGTVQVKGFPAGGAGPSHLVGMNGTLYFWADDGVHGTEPWRSDGTEAGTVLLKDISPGASSSDFHPVLYPAGHTLFIGAGEATHGYELWKSDGTEAGTVLVKDLVPGVGSGLPLSVTALGDGTAVFMAYDAEHGFEPWTTDGTEAGTVRLADVWPGPDHGIRFDEPDSAALFSLEGQGLVLFTGTDGSGSVRLWMTDGTPEGTRPAWTSTDGFDPRNVTRVGERLFFTAGDAAHGYELWSAPLPGAVSEPDRTAPQLTCPANVSVRPESPSSTRMRVDYPEAWASDAEGPTAVTYSHASGSDFPVGMTTVTVTATDVAGNPSQCTFDVTVEPPGCGCGAASSADVTAWAAVLGLLGLVRARQRTGA